MSMPFGSTAMVESPWPRAAIWAVMSIPKASPLTITGFSGARLSALTIRVHHSFPYGLMSRVPTIAIAGRVRKISSGGEALR